ncbi:electron transfer flavoprotein subunit alpha/FixB family protein [Azovibrio restrictus]|uniref:electron transfer flavoprotein subunit alpha/FixB family protein n=1 Tax=Azovibrio restrictus TaxID=146938 RepID=UPI0004082A02|nr:electron transfer flavoprotein subunit alpha/FixB family protein [Azovibrio restrictus]
MSEAKTDKPIKKRKIKLDEELLAYRGVWVFVESERSHVHPVSWELMGQGRRLADQLGVELCGVVMGAPGPDLEAQCQAAFAYGADRCYRIASPVLAEYRNVPFTRALTDLVNAHKPEILLLGATTLGRDLAGSVATTLKTGLTADCTELAIDPEDRCLLSTRPTFGGSLLCTIVTLNYRPQMATVRHRVMPMPDPQPERTGLIVDFEAGLIETDIVTKVLEFIPDDQRDKPQLPYAEIVVSGGKGLGKAENFKHVWDLAKVLGGEVGASRAAIHAGWISADRQVGQTGKTVRPALYIAAGISGAIQHRVGMEGADCIIAINNDPNAPIFDFAHYAIVGDCNQVLPALGRTFAGYLAHQGS